MRKGKNWKTLVAALLLINATTYVCARTIWYANGGVAAELQRVREIGDSGVMNYFIAGNVNQPERAFKFLEGKIDGGITYVTYSETRGCSMRQIVDQVLADARQQNCKVRFFGISIGDYVSRFAESELNDVDVETVAINPEPHSKILKPYAGIGLKILTPLMEGATVPLGWLSHIPCIRGFSFAFLADQWRDLAYCFDAPHVTDCTLGVICSSDDEFLQNGVIADYFKGVPIVMVEGRHADTQGNAEAYAEAWDELMRQIGRPR